MIDTPSVASLVERTSLEGDGAALKSRDLILMLLRHSAAPFSRDQFTPGHITGTGLVVAPGGEQWCAASLAKADPPPFPTGEHRDPVPVQSCVHTPAGKS